jgi:hypothetical protein
MVYTMLNDGDSNDVIDWSINKGIKKASLVEYIKSSDDMNSKNYITILTSICIDYDRLKYRFLEKNKIFHIRMLRWVFQLSYRISYRKHWIQCVMY